MATSFVIILAVIAIVCVGIIGIYIENARHIEINDSIKKPPTPSQNEDILPIIPRNFNSVNLVIGKMIPETEHLVREPDKFDIIFNIPKTIKEKLLKLDGISKLGVYNYYNMIREEYIHLPKSTTLVLPSLNEKDKITYIGNESSVGMIYRDTIFTLQFTDKKS